MEFLRDAAVDEGEWFTYHTQGAGDERVELRFKVRRVPEPVSTRIEFAHLGRKLRVRGDRNSWAIDREKQRAVRLDKAAYALVDSENGEVRAADAEAAAFYSAELKVQIVAGDLVKLDGRWTDAIRKRVLRESEPLRAWVQEKSEGQALAADEDEEGKD